MGIFDQVFKVGKKVEKAVILANNRAKGALGEASVALKYVLAGYDVERTGRGHDFRVTKRDLFTGKKVDEVFIEVKTGGSRLSRKQKEEKQRYGKKYRVERVSF